jgi:hypothetical protein
MKDGIPSRPGLEGLANFVAVLPFMAEIGTIQAKSLNVTIRRSNSWMRHVKNVNDSAIFYDPVTGMS